MRGRRLLLGLSAFTILFVGASHSSARAEQGLQFTNPIIDIQAERGKTYTARISLLNVTTSDLTYYTTMHDFRSKDENGVAEVLLKDYLPASSSLAKWIQPVGDIAIKAKQTKQIEVRIAVPADAEPGGHYGMVRFSNSAPELDQTGVAIVGSTGPLILVRVSGDVREHLDIKEFFVSRDNTRRGWFEASPVTFVERIQNSGNVHVQPTGDLTITDMFGKNIATLKVNEQKGNILPSSVRKFEQTLNKKRMFGRYTATVSLAYGTQGQVLLGATSFWIIPYKIIIAILLLLLCITLSARLLIRRYNDKIIKRALHEQTRHKK